MQLPLNVSPVSASFFGLQRLGIHRVLCRACTAACSPPWSSTSLLQARALPLLLLFALGKIEVIVIYFCNAVCKGAHQVTLTTGKWKPAQRVSLTRPTRSATPLNPCFPCSPLSTRTDLGELLPRLPHGYPPLSASLAPTYSTRPHPHLY